MPRKRGRNVFARDSGQVGQHIFLIGHGELFVLHVEVCWGLHVICVGMVKCAGRQHCRSIESETRCTPLTMSPSTRKALWLCTTARPPVI